MNSIFHIEGGLGKHVLSTAVIECYKNTYPEKNIIVSCHWTDVFDRNPNIDRVYKIGSNQYFYRDYILDQDVEVFAQEPYKQTSHITRNKHLIQTWCDMVEASYKNEVPSIYPNFREIEYASNLLSGLKNKPILIFQPFGGPHHQQLPYCWARDIHPNVAQQMVNDLSQKYNVVHVCSKHHPTLFNCVRFDEIFHNQILFSLLLQSEKRLLIDSCLQHASAALRLPSTVVWIVTNPDTFGYSIHNNIQPNVVYPKGNRESYLFDYEIGGIIPECPYSNPNEIFNYNKIMEDFL